MSTLQHLRPRSDSAARRITGAVIFLASIATTALGAAQELSPPASPETRRNVDLAICLDTSGSMEGLINAARQKLWAVVNELATAKPTPRLRVALLTYGNDGHPAAEGWVRIDTPFTDDLDTLSQQLFALTTNGGTELVGRVLESAVGKLEWSKDKESLKMIFIAGNESAEQDAEVDFRKVVKRAIESDILVNSIYCGPATDELAPAWREVALRADGQFACIDKDNGTVVIDTPFDGRLAELSGTVNETYLWFGAKGEEMKNNQVRQDQNATGAAPASAAERAKTKCGDLYVCRADLVDACADQSFKLEDIKAEDLPESMRKMTLDERKAYIAKMKDRRVAIQKEIQEVDAKRQQVIVEELKRQGLESDKAFDSAVLKAVREQACKKGFAFPKPEDSKTSKKD